MSRKKKKGFGGNGSPHYNKVNRSYQPINLGGQNNRFDNGKKCDCEKYSRNCLEVLSNWYGSLTEQDFDSSWISKLSQALQEALLVAKSQRANFAIVSFGGFEWRVSMDWFRHGAEFETSKIGVGIRPVTFLAATQLSRHKRQASKGGTV